MNTKNTAKAKNVQYVQQMAYLPAQTIDNLIDAIRKRLCPTKYAVILHDKDIDENGKQEAPHIHVMLSFRNARSVNSVAKLLNDKPQTVEMWSGNANNGYAYLIHATDSARNKHQYDISEVYANFDYATEISKITKEVEQSKKHSVNILLDLFYNRKISRKDVESQLSGSQYARNRRAIEDIHVKHLQDSAMEWRKEMAAQGKPVEIIWIWGLSATGKTSLAKEIAKKKQDPFFVTGSSRDIFQNYNGEHTLIVDELRPKSIPYQDLLRILDPFGADLQAMLPCRYSDKALACDLIIVTTPYNPCAFYNATFGTNNNPIDKFEQLLRRISLTVLMTETEICVTEYDESKAKLPGNQAGFVPMQGTNRINTYSSINYAAGISNLVELYDSILSNDTGTSVVLPGNAPNEDKKGEPNGNDENETASVDAERSGETD